MDPQACFKMFVDAIEHGDLHTARDCQRSYSEWFAKGGFLAEDEGRKVLELDSDKERYLVAVDGVERWRCV